ncbi:hypothetical protein OIU77_015568 [Salix suchowensis]|uniref:Uncharacterized protein n=1 Tax=Salix suchowensis TaxID=1278906 RepID=A0ABQ8ZHP1_9ROSI|nr:hypothetical protein OIU77_015568 [Salix suchowensis]
MRRMIDTEAGKRSRLHHQQYITMEPAAPEAVQSLKKGMGRNSSRKRVLVMDAASCHYIGKGDEHCSFRSFGRSNSFYSEAIADCLEFIKSALCCARLILIFFPPLQECFKVGVIQKFGLP